MIGKVLRAYRTWEQVTVREMAKQIGVSPATLSRIERGKPADQRSLIKLLTWLFRA